MSGEFPKISPKATIDRFFLFRKNVMLALDPIVHESYKSPKASSNDIALLKLAEDIDLTTYTPACLPTAGADYTGQNGRVYGGCSRAVHKKQFLEFGQ